MRSPTSAEDVAVAELAERWAGRGLGGLAAFLEDAALRSATDADESPEGKVLVSTVHRFKGGERDVTFVGRFNEGFMPVAASTEELDSSGKIVRTPVEAGTLEHAAHLA